MISSYKRGMSLLFLAHDKKKNIVFSIIMIVVGAIFEVLLEGTNILGALFLLLSAIYPTQMLISVAVSNLVCSSKDHKAIQLDYANALYSINSLLMMIVVIVIRWVLYKLYPENEIAIIHGMILAGAVSLLLGAYAALAYKYFITSIIIFLVFYFAGVILFTVSVYQSECAIVSMPVAIGIALLGAILGNVSNYFVAKWTLKKPISKLSQGHSLRKHM